MDEEEGTYTTTTTTELATPENITSAFFAVEFNPSVHDKHSSSQEPTQPSVPRSPTSVALEVDLETYRLPDACRHPVLGHESQPATHIHPQVFLTCIHAPRKTPTGPLRRPSPSLDRKDPLEGQVAYSPMPP
jgi:hypothetical protein